jgi:DNA polymerase III subunit epsilon
LTIRWPWQRRAAAPEPVRWVVVDVETSGLDPARDRLLAVAAIALHVDWGRRKLALAPGDSFEVVLRQDAAANDRANILLHGIGVQQQAEGTPMAQGLAAFTAFVGEAPLLAFHAAFDRALIDRHLHSARGTTLANPWLDIEHLCAATHPQVPARSLDEWLNHFGIVCAARHQAAADTWAECELMLRIWPRIARECQGWEQVVRLAAQHRWLPRA